MVNKKRSIIISILIGFIFLLPHVSAQLFFTTPSDFINDAIRGITDVFKPVLFSLFGEFGGEDFLFAKMLLGILLFVIINVVVKKVPMFRDNKSVSIIVALVISLLAIRFINENDLVNGILLPYGVLGVAITTILPFMIFSFFIYESDFGSFGRKLGIVFYIVVFFVLWISKSNSTVSGGLSPLSNQIYSWTLIALIIMFFADGTIKRLFNKQKAEKVHKKAEIKGKAEAEKIIHNFTGVPGEYAPKLVEQAKRYLREH